MRRMLLAVGALAAATGVAAAAGTSPAPGARFRGSGPNYVNKNKRWRHTGTGRISFSTSSDGSRILSFQGTYSYSCGGAATLSARYVTVNAGGGFDYPFTVHFKNGTFYAVIYGRFLRGGRRVDIDYLADFVATGKTVRHPLDVRHPGSLGCASWVRGVARTA